MGLTLPCVRQERSEAMIVAGRDRRMIDDLNRGRRSWRVDPDVGVPFFQQTIERLQKRQGIPLGRDRLDPFDCRFQRQHQAPHLQDVDRRLSQQRFSLKFDPSQFVDAVAQLRRISLDRFDGARQNRRKIRPERIRRKALARPGLQNARCHRTHYLPGDSIDTTP
jgi:hypothetical protein